MTRNLEPGLEPQAHVRVRMYRYSGATREVVAALVFAGNFEGVRALDSTIVHPLLL
jgi:hypothetical protein